MSTLEAILESLEGNPLVRVAHVDTDTFAPPEKGWSETVEIYVGPEGPIGDLDKLQELMMGLIPIKETKVGHVVPIRPHCYAGRLEFQDEIEVVDASDNPDDPQGSEGEPPLMRRIGVNVYGHYIGAARKEAI